MSRAGIGKAEKRSTEERTVQAILALNAGSSSIKFAVYEARMPAPVLLFRGMLDRHADDNRFMIKDAAGSPLPEDARPRPDQKSDLTTALLERIEPLLGGYQLTAVGHRIVHGGPDFSAPVPITADVIRKLDQLTPLAPLHQPACLDPARHLLSLRPALRQVACFDTAFHHDLAQIYRRFALPLAFEARGIRRYGFHGLSFEYIVQKLDRPDLRTVVAHLGSGCSLCAIRHGKSINTTMSMTPLDGVMMATRSGAIDPGAVLYLQQSEQMSVSELETLLYHKSGLLGVSGLSADMRTLLASANRDAKDAVDQFCARVAEQIAVMATAMNGMDRLIFTGGIGENSADVRNNVCARLQWLGIAADGTRSEPAGRVETAVIPTDEEFIIASHTFEMTR
jgi:acetate kinase